MKSELEPQYFGTLPRGTETKMLWDLGIILFTPELRGSNLRIRVVILWESL